MPSSARVTTVGQPRRQQVTVVGCDIAMAAAEAWIAKLRAHGHTCIPCNHSQPQRTDPTNAYRIAIASAMSV